MLTPAQQETIRYFLESFVEQIVDSYPEHPDYARIALLVAMSGKNAHVISSYMDAITDDDALKQATQFIGRLFNGEHNLRTELTRCGATSPNDAEIQAYGEEILPRLFLQAYQKLDSYKNDDHVRMRIFVIAYFLANHRYNWYGDKGVLRGELTVSIHNLKQQLSIRSTPPKGHDGYSPANLSNLDLSYLQIPLAEVKCLNLQGCNLRGINFFGCKFYHLEIDGAIRHVEFDNAIRQNNRELLTVYSGYHGNGVEMNEVIATIPHDRRFKAKNSAGLPSQQMQSQNNSLPNNNLIAAANRGGLFDHQQPPARELALVQQIQILQEENKRLKEQLEQKQREADSPSKDPERNCAIM